MKAIVINDFGGPEQLQLVDRPMPPITDEQVLVAVHVAAVNPIDWRIRKGQLKDFVAYEFPAIMGREVSGVVAQVGAAVRDFAVGDAVLGFLQQRLMHWGGYAEYVPVEAAKLAHKPANLSFEQAAALPVAGHTAWQGLFEVAQLKPGEVVLITGAAGGVGSLAVQLACDAGATVIASASPANHDFVRSLGAALVVDYQAPDFAASIAARVPVRCGRDLRRLCRRVPAGRPAAGTRRHAHRAAQSGGHRTGPADRAGEIAAADRAGRRRAA